MRKSMILIALASIGGCATQSVAWMKADGSAVTPEQRQLAMTICQGETQKAKMSSREDGLTLDPHRGLVSASDDVYAGCMAQQGFVAVSGGR